MLNRLLCQDWCCDDPFQWWKNHPLLSVPGLDLPFIWLKKNFQVVLQILMCFFFFFVLTAYSLKHARDLVRAITQKVRGGTRRKGLFAQMSAMSIHESQARSRMQTAPRSATSQSLGGGGEPVKMNQGMLPPLKPRGFLTYWGWFQAISKQYGSYVMVDSQHAWSWDE